MFVKQTHAFSMCAFMCIFNFYPFCAITCCCWVRNATISAIRLSAHAHHNRREYIRFLFSQMFVYVPCAVRTAVYANNWAPIRSASYIHIPPSTYPNQTKISKKTHEKRDRNFFFRRSMTASKQDSFMTTCGEKIFTKRQKKTLKPRNQK